MASKIQAAKPGRTTVKAKPDIRRTAPAPVSAIKVEQPPKEPPTVMLGRGLDLLDALAVDGPLSATELAARADVTAAVVAKLLKIMETRGFAVSDPESGAWRVGAKWAAFGKAAAEQGSLAATALPFLTALGTATGENTYLRVRDGMSSETVAVYQTDPTLRLYNDVGSRGPLHAGTARMLLAYAPESVQTQLLTQRLPRFTPATRTDATWIAADLQRIRARGYLITADEVVPGAVSVAAPVRDASGEVVAIISIAAPTIRMRPPRPRAMVAQVQDAAAKLSHTLGYSRSDTMVTVPATLKKPSAAGWSVASMLAARTTASSAAPRA